MCCLIFCSTHLYADDSQLYLQFSRDSLDEAREKINIDLDNISKLSESMCLSINPSKTVVMLFGRKVMTEACKDLIRISVNGAVLPLTSECRNLGLIMDSDLRFDSHINLLLKRAFVNIKLIYGCKEFLDIRQRKMLCEALVLSHLNYCDTVYGPCLTKQNVARVQKIQNWCVRIVFNLRRTDRTSCRRQQLGWLNMAACAESVLHDFE
ncbi:hypothetical protein HHI36_003216 [Cryptolaemus montrouzieri]|uniref:Reverse transcriptase domain-containing protein n=1 Tax=Cryptolaemus montrouzieri TaxID=559131 RepID=A0ABD2PD94_9CUCU